MRLLRAYLLPITLATLLAAAWLWWIGSELQRSTMLAHADVNRQAAALLASIEGSLQSSGRRGKQQSERLRSVLEGVVASANVPFIAVIHNNAVCVCAGKPPPALQTEIHGDSGSRILDPVIICWKTVRLQDCPMGLMGGGGMMRGRGAMQESYDLDFGSSSQLLAIGLPLSSLADRISADTRRIYSLGAAGLVAIAALFVSWLLSLRHRAASEALAIMRMKEQHLQELSLAAAGLAHETKNPLGIIRGLAQTIAADATLPGNVRERVEAIMEESDRTTARLGEFLNYARTATPALQPVPLRPLLERLAQALQPDFETAGVGLSLDVEDCAVMADADMLQRLVLNLLLNALHAAPRGTAIDVRTRREQGMMEFMIQDRGPGLPNNVRAQLFQPYVSGRAGGHGLGLAIAKRIADEHGWEIALDSGPQPGTTARISRMRGAAAS